MADSNPGAVPTLRSIAAHTGLSVPTVSQVLSNQGGRYRATTRDRVLKAARDLGYRPNAAARAVSLGRFGCVALLTSNQTDHSYVPRELLNGLLEALDESNLHLTLLRLSDERLTSEETVPKILRQWLVDGLLIDYIASIPQRLISLLHQHHVPSIWLNIKHATDSVHPDDYDAGVRATRRLLALGHRRIAYGHYRLSAHYSAKDRFEGYCHAMRDAGLTPVTIGPESVDSFTQAIDQSMPWLSRPDRPTAVVVYSAWYARAVFRAAEQLRLAVPRELSIVTFDDQVWEDYGISFSTMVVPNARVAQTATRLLRQKIDRPLEPIPSVAVPFEDGGGTSTAPPPDDGLPNRRAAHA